MSDLNVIERQDLFLERSDEDLNAIVVGVAFDPDDWSLDVSLAELIRLADTDGLRVVGQVTQRLESKNPRTLVGRGKVEEIAELIRARNARVVVFDEELTPSQQSNLEKCFGKRVEVIDRTALILDIFALHATSREGRLQVQLAKNQYLYPRLRGMWAHLESNRMGGGVGSRFGEGESQLEVDRRIVRQRISSIKRTLDHLGSVRSVQRSRRYSSGVFKVALAGYTNAGKSSLLNSLCDADVLCYDKLFATLDSVTRKLKLPDGRTVTLTDTVGFIHKLPHSLVEAFKSTLEDVKAANLILHVIDASSPEYLEQIATVREVLEEIGAQEIPCIEIFNKIDTLSKDELDNLSARFPHAYFVSAQTGENLDKLVDGIALAASAADVHLDVVIPYSEGALVNLAHEQCHIVTCTYSDAGTHLVLFAPPEIADLFMPYAS